MHFPGRAAACLLSAAGILIGLWWDLLGLAAAAGMALLLSVRQPGWLPG